MTAKETKRNRTRFLILLALSHGKKHGYEISKFITDRTKGFFSLPFGSLYPVLHKLEKEKVIVASWVGTDSHKPKKSYALTKAGKKALTEEVENFRTSTTAIKRLIPAGI